MFLPGRWNCFTNLTDGSILEVYGVLMTLNQTRLVLVHTVGASWVSPINVLTP